MCRPGESVEPWKVLKVSKEEFEAKVAEAEARGIITCEICGYRQYRQVASWLCGLCNTIQTDVAV